MFPYLLFGNFIEYIVIMRQYKNTVFIESLVSSNFIFLSSKLSISKSKFFFSLPNLKKKSSLTLLDLFKTQVSIKQFLRILYLFKNHKENSNIFIFSADKAKCYLINILLDNSIKQDFHCVKLVPNLDFFPKKLVKKNLSIFIDNNRVKRFLSLIINGFFLIQQVNLFFNKLIGTYKIFNDLSDIKKLLFFISLIRN